MNSFKAIVCARPEGIAAGVLLATCSLFTGSASADVFNLGPGLTNLEFVTVGNSGNTADPQTGLGAVNYGYSIGTYEVTNAQYADFLNNVAATDTHGLYHTGMADFEFGSRLNRSGSSGSYSYAPTSGYENRPIGYVNWYDAARFTNWLHNGQGNGDTENGVYDLSLIDSDPNAIAKQANSQYWLPTENEWYKAAFHQLASQGGDADDYWLQATQSNSLANNLSLDGANYNMHVDGVNNFVNYPNDVPSTDVGSYTQASSFYGTFDQAGNLQEWTFDLDQYGRDVHGGGWVGWEHQQASTATNGSNPLDHFGVRGFRVATVPEPASLAMLGLGGLAFGRRRK